MLQAEGDAQRSLARLADTRAECNEQHKVMTAELEAMQDSVKCSLRDATQQTTVQAAKVDAMRYRLEEMKDLLLQRELRMEVQVAELSNQIRTLGAASRAVAPGTEQAKTVGPVASTSKMVPMRTPNPPVTLKTSPKTERKVLKPPPTGKKTTKHTQFTQHHAITIDDVANPNPGSSGRPHEDPIVDRRPNRHQSNCWLAH